MTPHPRKHHPLWTPFRRATFAGLGLLGLLNPPALHAATEVQDMLAWIASTRDNAAMPFVIIDKRAARLHVFDASGRAVDNTPVLLGLAKGDETAPGVGDKPLSQVRPEERTTPAGRFAGQRGRNLGGEDIVWIDYEAAVSMHRVRASNPKERRLQRLASSTVEDNRISYGCVNVPARFFDAHIAPTFAGQRAMVYVLPEHKTLQDVFGMPAPVAVR